MAKRNYISPFVSVIIAAFNEEKHIGAKLINTLQLDYPKERMEIIIGSDGSTDHTPEIVKKYAALCHEPQITLLHFPENRGKTSVQNDCVKAARGDILLFMDAASFLDANAIMKIIRNFADARVGGVAGLLRFVNISTNLTTESQGVYWRYEAKIRELESKVGSIIGVDGPLYALRRENYVQLDPRIISDFISPLLVLASGKKVVLEPEAIVREEPTLRAEQELRTRRRITVRALTSLVLHKDLLNVFKYPALGSQIIFHKLLRWFVGPFVMINFLASMFLIADRFFFYVFCAYLIFFATAIFGFAFSMLGIRWRVMTVPYYFVLVNFAATLGVMDAARRKQAVTWQPTRD